MTDFYSKTRSNLYTKGLPIPFCEDQAYSIFRIAHSYAKLCHHAKVSKYDMFLSIQLFLQGWQYAAWDPDSGQMDVGTFYNPLLMRNWGLSLRERLVTLQIERE